MKPIGELMLWLEIRNNRFEHSGIQQTVAGGERDVFVYDGGAAGGRLPIDAIVAGNAHEEIDDHEMLARNVHTARREAAMQNLYDGRREIIDMCQRPFLVQISVEHKRFALSRHGEAFVDMAGGRGIAILLAIEFAVTEDVRRNGVAAEAAPCLEQVLGLSDGGVAKAVRIDFGIFADAAAVGVADVRGGEIDKMDLFIDRMAGGQIFAEGRQRLDMLVSIQRDIVAEQNQRAVEREVVMEIISCPEGDCVGRRRRGMRPVANDLMAGRGHGLAQMGADEGINTDYNA